MEKCIGVITSGNPEDTLQHLCVKRPVYMLPFGGRYRLIDFTLSQLVNHDINKVCLYAGKIMRSTIEHIGNGKPWELNRRVNGLSIFPPTYDDNFGNSSEIVNMYGSLPFFENAFQDNILLINPLTIAKVDLSEAYEKFISSGMDGMLIYKRQEDHDGKYLRYDKLEIDKNEKVLSLGINLGTENILNLSLGMCFMKKSVYINLIKRAVERGLYVSMKQVLASAFGDFNFGSYEFSGHVEIIKNTKSYYDANMNLLNQNVYQEIFYKEGMIFTKSKDEPSTQYTNTSKVANSLIANGCYIEGQVENSIIFRGVNIGKNTIIKNSILMQDTFVEDNAVLINVIIDKYGIVKEGVSLIGSNSNPLIIEKLEVITKGK